MKKEIRNSILKRRNSMSPQDAELLSLKLQDNVLKWDKFILSKTTMLYYNYKNEAGTTLLIDACLNLEKTLVLPRVIKESREILTCVVDSLEDFTVGAYGIMEPIADKIVSSDEIDLVIIPGVAFDMNGNRIGHGAGYYDKFLKNYKGIKAAICYEFQIVDNAYPDEHDIKMDYIITENRIIEIDK